MILQPIVENAVFHGLEPNEEQGTLTIKSFVDEHGNLLISVEDDGLGMSPDRLEHVRNNILLQTDYAGRDREQERQFSNIGLSNVNNRIKLTYGNQYGLQIYSALGEGTQIQLIMPVGGKQHV